jgi:uncharacterized protein (TIGR02246 family)
MTATPKSRPGPVEPTGGRDAEHARERIRLAAGGLSEEEATRVVADFVEELQTGIDDHDADHYNRHFATDVLWGGPYGATVSGYDDLHAIHVRHQQNATGGPSSRYATVNVRSPGPETIVAQVRRVALDTDGEPMPTLGSERGGASSEIALYVLVRRHGAWWLAAGQNTPIRPGSADDDDARSKSSSGHRARPRAMLAPVTAADARSISDVLDRFGSEHVGTIDSAFTEDAVLVAPDGNVISGWEALLAYHTGRRGGPAKGWQITVTVETLTAIDRATVIAHVRQDVATHQGTFRNRGTAVLVRRDDAWWVARYHNTRDESAAMAE